MTTEIDICNKTILRLGGNMVSTVSGLVVDLTPDSLEAKLCLLNYALVRDIVTEDRVWSFALSKVVLDTPDIIKPVFGFDNRFPKPTDALNIWRVHYDNFNSPWVAGMSEVLEDWRVEGAFILANAGIINVEYVRRMDQVGDIDLFTSQFIDSFSLRLAVEFAIPLTENEKLFASLAGEYEKRKTDAYAINGSQAKHESFRSTELTRVR